MLITICTPTYNRAHLLPRVYESLQKQTCKDFEWIVVDDGSTDNTQEVVEGWIDALTPNRAGRLTPNLESFKIRYVYKNNGGKHTAVNRGVREAKGELFFILDSDDVLPADALETVAQYYPKIADRKDLCGITGLDAYFDGKIIGTGLPQAEIISNNIVLRNKYGVDGDMKEVFKTSVLREFPFPQVEGERFCPEDLLWNRISAKYDMLYINRVIYLAEYQEGGISSNIVKVRMNSPIASTTYYRELIAYDIPFAQKLKGAINFWRFWYCLKPGTKVETISWLWLFAKPLGYIMHRNDLKKLK